MRILLFIVVLIVPVYTLSSPLDFKSLKGRDNAFFVIALHSMLLCIWQIFNKQFVHKDFLQVFNF